MDAKKTGEKIATGCDHGGLTLKNKLIEYLEELGYEVEDFGTTTHDRVDYPDYGAAVGRAVASGRANLGLLVCGSGIGIGIAANKISGVRAATVHDVTSAHLAREHNDANIICLGERLIGEEIAKEALSAFLASVFEGGRHADRVAKINAL
ncbi:MAG: ribose 5-phosphate isomerase B [Acidimicrobiaceae bacterium]|nr:MAG: ribose 5-phosphate isomerase [marine actinobacterium MedAcidi-G2A]MAT01638.1 ribose 5-phosphate isomerase B [Acidimicrobiaceae bacterium]MAT03344.1 ribose 5-phosphate isomerase B [Acidimicrobiaceae bacterium]MBA4811154.1 ribose 5-phosphate isomerase B [Acidimicrobiales bacterium]MBC84997.1 ribose 5-phosphate isomerase B [Acidimicrobiaceae bacterium]|tara:strand:- start:13165 stop:13617 length:453 start_codon:yes stop_codon:yes gene_type:complete